MPPVCRALHGTQQLAGQAPRRRDVAASRGPPRQYGANPGRRTSLAQSNCLANGDSRRSDPTSSQYRTALTPVQFAAAYGPAQSNYNALTSFVQSNGLTVSKTFTSRSLLAVTGTVAAVETAFSVTLNVYKRPDGTTFYAPANEPSLNLGPAVLHISGLDSFAVPHPANGGTGPSGCDPAPTAPSYVGGDFRKSISRARPAHPACRRRSTAPDSRSRSWSSAIFTSRTLPTIRRPLDCRGRPSPACSHHPPSLRCPGR